MDSVNDVKQALSAKARTATLDELASEGRKRVRMIRAEQVASMIEQAVHKAMEQSGQASTADVSRLVEKSRNEFRAILKEREAEVVRAREMEERLVEAEERARALEDKLQQAQGPRGAAGPGPAGAGTLAAGAAMTPEMLAALVHELASLKANQGPQASGGTDLTAALDKLAGTLNERLDQFGRKIGISSAVAAGEIDFQGLFRHDDKNQLESNIENIQVKEKAGGGIAANLAKLKKLKGGG
jgi:hypothetical protein